MSLRPFAAHLFADWLLQGDWIAKHKADLRHPSAWIHAGLHGLVQIPLLGPRRALVVTVTHALIDTRKPLAWWGRVVRATDEPAFLATDIALWRDQTLHVLVLAALERP